MTDTSNNIAAHSAPIWRDRANFLIVCEWEPGHWEQLWARQVDQTQFEICCIPFFAYDLSLGDLVETESRDGKDYVVRRVVNRAGRYVFRVWFGDVADEQRRAESKNQVVLYMTDQDCDQEWSSSNLLALATSRDNVETVGDYLTRQQDMGNLTFESGWTQ
jgi:hypothetical protein